MLKDEIRRLDSVHGVRDMSAAYAKNVLFKFFAADDREVRGSAWNVTVHARRPSLTHGRHCCPWPRVQPLVPVVATLLHLTANEARQLREKVAAQAPATAEPASTLASWLAFG